MRNLLQIVMISMLLCVVSGPPPFAQELHEADSQGVIDRANNLKSLLDKLLAETNHSSIHEAIENGDRNGDPAIEEALKLKEEGEAFLAEGDHLHAAMSLQAALDKLFQAIRGDNEVANEEARTQARLDEAVVANDTFIAAATRVLNGGSNSEAADFLAEAQEVRARADASAANGDTEAAMQALSVSTELAQQAIMSVRNGMVIERGP